MPDLLTHVLVAYAAATVASWRYEWLGPPYVTVAMMGAMIPDMTKVRLLVPSYRVESLLGVPFDWFALHTAGGSVVAVLVGTLLVPSRQRRRVFVLLALGAASHHLLDLLLINPSGHSYAVLWPLTGYEPPTPGFYLSTDRWPTLTSGALALLVRLLDARRPVDGGTDG